MAKIVKVADNWTESEMRGLLEMMADKGIDGIVVSDSELEVYEVDGGIEKITIEGEEVLEEERFSGSSLYGGRQ